MSTRRDLEKKIAGEYASGYIREGMTVGLGTGSTAYYMILKLAEQVKNGMNIRAVSTSTKTTALAVKLGIPLISIDEVDSIDVTIDGVDEFDTRGYGIKGGGGALLIEKIVAAASKKVIWIADSAKMVEAIGKFPLPIEIIPFGHVQVLNKLDGQGWKPVLRMKEGQPFVTDSGHYIFDLHRGLIEDAEALEASLNSIPGIVDTGLFLGMADEVIIGREDKAEVITFKRS